MVGLFFELLDDSYSHGLSEGSGPVACGEGQTDFVSYGVVVEEKLGFLF